MAFEQSAVLPTSVTTAASGLYNEDKLGLPLPSENPKPAGKTILVWGGSSAVGSMAVQLAAASGVKAIAIASTRNHALVRALGASTVIDYKSPNVVDEIVAAINDGSKDFAGVFDAISEPDSYEKVGQVLQKLDNNTAPRVVNVLPPQSRPDGFQPLLGKCTTLSATTYS